MKIFHCAANSGLLSCLPMVYPACCPLLILFIR